MLLTVLVPIRAVMPECARASEMRIARISSLAGKSAAPRKSKKKTERLAYRATDEELMGLRRARTDFEGRGGARLLEPRRTSIVQSGQSISLSHPITHARVQLDTYRMIDGIFRAPASGAQF